MVHRCLMLMAVVGGLPAGAVETMRIEMGDLTEGVTISGDGLAVGADSETGVFVAKPAGHVSLRAVGDAVVLNGAPWTNGPSVRFRAGGLQPDGSGPGKGTLQAGKWTVRGDVVARVHKGALQLINVIPLEDYVAAVLGGEMPVTFPEEALKAQAVAARTYALSRKLAALDAPYFLNSTVLSQVYGGVHREDARTRSATEATLGLVLTYALAPIEAYFHSSCGGRTESGMAALGRDLPYLQPVDCPCRSTKASHWSLQVPESELRARFHEGGPIVITDRSATGRARRVRVGQRSMDGVTFREKLGYDRIKSLSFEVEHEAAGLVLEGEGWGHGAGLCQVGAKALAGQGWDYARILAHYYPGTELQHLY